MRFLVTLVALFFITTTAHAEFVLQDDFRTTGNVEVDKELIVTQNTVLKGTTTINNVLFVGSVISYDSTFVSMDNLEVNGNTSILGNTTLGDVVTLTGDARPIKYKWLPHTGIKAYTGIQPAYNPAVGAGGSWEYSDGALTALQFVFSMPEDVDDTEDIYICPVWSCATQGKVGNFYLKYSVIGEDEDATAVQHYRQGYKKSSATANGVVVSEITIDVVSYDSTDVYIACTYYRDSTVVEDTLDAVSELYGVKLKYTSNKLGEEI